MPCKRQKTAEAAIGRRVRAPAVTTATGTQGETESISKMYAPHNDVCCVPSMKYSGIHAETWEMHGDLSWSARSAFYGAWAEPRNGAMNGEEGDPWSRGTRILKWQKTVCKFRVPTEWHLV